MELDINAVEHLLGEVSAIEQLCPDVWYLAIDSGKHTADEHYIAAAYTQCLSNYAKSLGKTIDGVQGLLFYSLDEIDGGKYAVRYEVQRYLIQHNLPTLDDDSILTTAMSQPRLFWRLSHAAGYAAKNQMYSMLMGENAGAAEDIKDADE